MQNATFRNVWTAIEDASHDIVRASRRVARAIAVMPWSAILVCCIGLALLATILPLALILFVVFMGIKIVIGAFVVDRRRAATPACTDYKD